MAILEFTFGNFRSFQTLQTLSMTAANISSINKELDANHTFMATTQQKLLHSKAIYGANASGKSNIIKAINAFTQIIKNSVIDNTAIKKYCQPFLLDEKGAQSPIFFQLIFIHQSVKYRYGFEVLDNKVGSEWLFVAKKGREAAYFTADTEGITIKNAFKYAKPLQNSYKTNKEIFNPTALFLSSLSAVGNKTAQTVTAAIAEIVTILGANDPMPQANLLAAINKQASKDLILELINAADIDITDLNVSNTNLLAAHRQYDDQKNATQTINANFEEWESEGTKKMAVLSPILIAALANGHTLVIDGFELHLHPNLAHKIVSLFHSPETNPHHAQLIFVTNDTALLKPDKLRRDQICFIEKDRYGSSTIHDLVEFKGVRNDNHFDKAYLQGRYGAIPFLNGIEQVFLS
jgi:AAA15 family ATPase/GTPase